MKTILIQQDIIWGDIRANLEALGPVIDKAGKADLYVLPEMFTTGFSTLPGSTVEFPPSEGLQWLRKKSEELGAAMAGSIALRVEGGKNVNRMYFVTPDGTVRHYDKRHLFGYGGEGEAFNAGEERVVVEYLGVRFLLAVCYDLRFPVWLRNHGDYDAMIISANWPDVRRFAWDTLTRARAIENQCYVLAVNRCGEDPACVYDGGTALIGPYGETVSAVEDGRPGFCGGEIDMEHLNSFRKKFPVLEGADRFEMARPE